MYLEVLKIIFCLYLYSLIQFLIYVMHHGPLQNISHLVSFPSKFHLLVPTQGLVYEDPMTSTIAEFDKKNKQNLLLE